MTQMMNEWPTVKKSCTLHGLEVTDVILYIILYSIIRLIAFFQ